MYTRAEYLTMLFVVCMVAVAEHFQVKEVIFPEVAALAFGAWVMEERPWHGGIWTIWFSTTLGAITGVLILRLAPQSVPAMVGLAFLFILIELRLFRSAMSPAFSAAILPILTGITSWVYPAAVCVMAAIVAGVAAYREKKRDTQPFARDILAKRIREGHPSVGAEVAHYGKLLLFVLLVAIFSVKSGWMFTMAPPLFVAFFELAEPGSLLRKKSMPRVLLLYSLAAMAGMFWVLVVAHAFAGPLWIAAGFAVASVFLLVRILGVGSPPAFALALLPTILPRGALALYPLHVLLGTLLFVAFTRLGFKPSDSRN